MGFPPCMIRYEIEVQPKPNSKHQKQEQTPARRHRFDGRENGCNHRFGNVGFYGRTLYAKWWRSPTTVLCYVGHLMSGLRPYFFTSGHILDLIGDIPAVKSSKLPCSMFFIAQTFTISQGE